MLNDKQRKFAHEYIVDLNARRAYERAYGEKQGESAQSAGSRLLSHVEVQALIQRLYRDRLRRSDVKADDVVQAISAVAFSDPRKLLDDNGQLRPLHELDDASASAIAQFDVTTDTDGSTRLARVKTWDKVRALEALAKHLGLVGPERHLHAHAHVVQFSDEVMQAMSDKQLDKVEQAYALLAEVEHELQK